MSFRTAQQNNIASRGILNAHATYLNGVWVRNPSWLTIPAIVSANEKFAGLVRVDENAAFASIQLAVSSGTYTVDWGDGTAPQTYTSDTIASYEYSFAASGLNNTNGPVTFTDVGDTVNRTAHGYTNGMTISFATITTTTGITAGQTYYVVNATANTFQVATTEGGSAIALTTNGSGVILPYKQAIIQAYPTTGGQTITKLWTYVANATAGLNLYQNGWLDIITASSATSVQFSTTGVMSSYLQQVNLIRCASTTFANLLMNCYQLSNVVQLVSSATVTDFSNMFFSCRSLITVPLFDTSAGTNFSTMFNGCVQLKYLPLFNTALGTNFTSMINGSKSLQTIPLFNTALGTNFTSMFQNCTGLTSVPLLNTASATNFTQMFQACTSLQTVPLFNTASVTTMTNMFNACSTLTSVPLFNTANVTNFAIMFGSCGMLKTVPLFNMASATNLSSMFSSCTALTSVPLFNTATVTNMSGMFNTCTMLVTIPLFSTANVTDMSSMFSGCSMLSYVPPLVTTANQQFGSMFFGCTSLTVIPAMSGAAGINSTAFSNLMASTPSISIMGITGIKYSFGVSGAKLSGTQLDAIYTSLATVGGAVTFTDVGDLVTKTAHGYLNGQTIVFASVVTTTGITAGPTYFVINQTANTFQVSLTSGGAAINLVTNGTGTIAAQNITVSSNYGISTDTPSIATAKGWTVTGS